MEIIFKDGHKIEFKQFGNIWLAESVIWEDTKLHGSIDELHILKAKINQWFAENAPEEISDRFMARLPLRGEIEPLAVKEQIAYREGRTDEIVDYLLGDENRLCPVFCLVGYSDHHCGLLYRNDYYDWSSTHAVRLCLEER